MKFGLRKRFFQASYYPADSSSRNEYCDWNAMVEMCLLVILWALRSLSYSAFFMFNTCTSKPILAHIHHIMRNQIERYSYVTCKNVFPVCCAFLSFALYMYEIYEMYVPIVLFHSGILFSSHSYERIRIYSIRERFIFHCVVSDFRGL